MQAAAAAESAKVCKSSRLQNDSKFTQHIATVDLRAHTRHQDVPYSVETRGGTTFYESRGQELRPGAGAAVAVPLFRRRGLSLRRLFFGQPQTVQ